MTFALGARSLGNLAGVHPAMVAIVKAALAVSPVDFGVPAKAVRTLDEQKALLKQGVTKTLKSKHLVHDDGYGWAVDLVPYIGGQFTWQTTAPFYVIADAMRKAAVQADQDVTWGAVWDRLLNDLHGLEAEVAAYKARHPGPDFIDFPHFQLGRN